MPSFILIHPTVWPQYTNVTDRHRQTDRQRPDSIGQTVLQTVAQKRFALCYQTVVCPICNIGVRGQTVGWNNMKPGMRVGHGPGYIVLDGDPAPPKGAQPPPKHFQPISVVAKSLDGLSHHLVWR